MKNIAFRVITIGAVATFMLVGLAASLSGGQGAGSMAAFEREQAARQRVAAQEERMTNGTVSGVLPRGRAQEYASVAAYEPPMTPSQDWREEYQEVRSTPISGPRVVYEGDSRSADRDAWRERVEEGRRQQEVERLERQLDSRLYGR
ncbi:hypothetical protein BWI17_18575 [Betaproteobacteria bacterium GR16-43]|nr:hypothetical protein BWI17_18575 [Betaproteobacteria bacterium GR16-43]